MSTVGDLPADVLRGALRLLGAVEPPAGRAQAARELRGALGQPGAVRSLIDAAPPGARDAFVRLADVGPLRVQDLLGRGWWGHGALPPPLDWLQRRALVAVGPDGLVHPVEEAREGLLDLTLGLAGAGPGGPDDARTVRVEAAGCAVVAPDEAALGRALTVSGAALRAVAPTVALSPRSAEAVVSALRGAGVGLGEDAVVAAQAHEPALPGTAEDAVGPRAVRSLLERGVEERRQVWLRYFASSRGGAATERVVDPWSFSGDLLRGWCHLRLGERTFAVDRVGLARLLPSANEHEPPG